MICLTFARTANIPRDISIINHFDIQIIMTDISFNYKFMTHYDQVTDASEIEQYQDNLKQPAAILVLPVL